MSVFIQLKTKYFQLPLYYFTTLTCSMPHTEKCTHVLVTAITQTADLRSMDLRETVILLAYKYKTIGIPV